MKNIKLLAAVAAALCLSVAAHVVSALTLDRSLDYTEVAFHAPRLPPGMDGYTVAFISDTHAMTVSALEDVARKLNARGTHLLLLGGDYAVGPALEGTLEALARVDAADGIYGVEGNHDDSRQLFGLMERHGIMPLSNSGAHVRDGFYLAGVEDLWNGRPDVAKATAGADDSDFVLLLSHNPDVTMLQDTTKADLILSGHTHGGQVTLFGMWAPILTLTKANTAYGQRFMGGWAEGRAGTPVYVSKGAGSHERTPRVFARPQVIIITLSN